MLPRSMFLRVEGWGQKLKVKIYGLKVEGRRLGSKVEERSSWFEVRSQRLGLRVIG